MGVAHLTKVTIISPRSEYEDVVKVLARFEYFHPIYGTQAGFDPAVQELTVKAVRLFAQADQATKDLELKLMPGQMDIVFRGEKVPRRDFDAESWRELLGKAETQLTPIAEEVRALKARLQKAAKEETDSSNLMGALKVVSSFSTDIGALSGLKRMKALVVVVANVKLPELRGAVPDAFFFSQSLSSERTLVLVGVQKSDEPKLEKALKLLELKPVSIPPGMPQNPSQAFQKAEQDHAASIAEKEGVEAEMEKIRHDHGDDLLATRELAEVSRKMLDEARISGGMKRLATVRGYVPSKEEERVRQDFSRWIVHTVPVRATEERESAPTLLENRPGLNIFQPITGEQGIPGGHEIDPTPLVSFVFPIFFGMMFGDVGHGIILTLFMLLVRQRATGTMRQWANLFAVAGISSIVFGAIFGEFFELSLKSFIPIPPVIEIIHRAAGSVDSFDINGVYLIMEIAILIGVAHLITGLSLDIYQGTKEHDRLELFLEKVPALTMYLSGVGYGIAFIGVGFSFNVFKATTPAPLLGVPNNVLGGVSLAILLPSMIVLLAGKAVAVATGKLKGESVGEALFNGGLEVFERISQFLSNTISYVRLAVLLLVHAALLLIINLMQPWANPILIAPWVILNLVILAFEAFIVYVQDLRLHLYEFFTKFFLGTGKPFRKILPDRARIRINWR